MRKTKPKILLVEDEPNLTELVTLLLNRNGYQVASVSDGTQVIQSVKKEKPDLIILDIMIPKLNGYEVCQKIKNDRTLKQIPVLVLSALVQKGEIEMGIRMGADIYLTKPFQNADLLDHIKQLLKEKSK